MSAYSTLKVTESYARQRMIEKAMTASWSELEKFMDSELEDKLYNAIIVSNDDDDADLK